MSIAQRTTRYVHLAIHWAICMHVHQGPPLCPSPSEPFAMFILHACVQRHSLCPMPSEPLALSILHASVQRHPLCPVPMQRTTRYVHLACMKAASAMSTVQRTISLCLHVHRRLPRPSATSNAQRTTRSVNNFAYACAPAASDMSIVQRTTRYVYLACMCTSGIRYVHRPANHSLCPSCMHVHQRHPLCPFHFCM